MKLNTYTAHFIGRELGAIGAFYRITTTIQAPDKDSARMSLYDRYEHIQCLSLITEVAEPD
jgi:hypothetical protein